MAFFVYAEALVLPAFFVHLCSYSKYEWVVVCIGALVCNMVNKCQHNHTLQIKFSIRKQKQKQCHQKPILNLIVCVIHKPRNITLCCTARVRIQFQVSVPFGQTYSPIRVPLGFQTTCQIIKTKIKTERRHVVAPCQCC